MLGGRHEGPLAVGDRLGGDQRAACEGVDLVLDERREGRRRGARERLAHEQVAEIAVDGREALAGGRPFAAGAARHRGLAQRRRAVDGVSLEQRREQRAVGVEAGAVGEQQVERRPLGGRAPGLGEVSPERIGQRDDALAGEAGGDQCGGGLGHRREIEPGAQGDACPAWLERACDAEGDVLAAGPASPSAHRDDHRPGGGPERVDDEARDVTELVRPGALVAEARGGPGRGRSSGGWGAHGGRRRYAGHTLTRRAGWSYPGC
jgi:hypothetical protein